MLREPIRTPTKEEIECLQRLIKPGTALFKEISREEALKMYPMDEVRDEL